jgi:hypothetical protein
MKILDMLKSNDAGRMRWWLWLALATSLLVLALFPHQIGTVLAKANLLTLAAWAGYWIDRSAFPYARPGDLEGVHQDAAGLRRAVVIAATMLAMALAL